MLRRHLWLAVPANLLSAGLLLLGGYLSGGGRAVSWACAVVIWGVLWVFIEKIVRPRWAAVKRVWFYFLLTGSFLIVLEQRRRIQDLEKQLRDVLRSSPPGMRLLAQIIDPEQRTCGLSKLAGQMITMSDQRLALLIDEIRINAPAITQAGGDEYSLFREIVGKLTGFNPPEYPATWDYFLALLGAIYDPEQPDGFATSVKSEMLTPLGEAAKKVEKRHLDAFHTVISNIMAGSPGDHDNPRAVLRMMADEKCQQPVLQLIFEEAKKRAFRYPDQFGYHLLYVLRQIEHKVFWLDLHSLQHLLTAPDSNTGDGLISHHQGLYDQLCRGVFSPLVDAGHEDKRHGRVFRRLQGDCGKVKVKCRLASGDDCECDGKSLSFRGLFSQECHRPPGYRVTRATLSSTVNGGREFSLAATVADQHTDEKGNPVGGRGVLFEDGEEDTIRGLYDYVVNPD